MEGTVRVQSARTIDQDRAFVALMAGWLAGDGGPTVPTAAAPSDRGRRAAAPGSITLTSQSARSVAAGPGFVHEGDPVTSYKWMVNVDDTGDPGTAADPGHARSCLPPGAEGGSTDPDFADTCPWPSIRYTPGWTADRRPGRPGRPQRHARPSTASPPGKYLISVTADGFKIDGAHFTVHRRRDTTPVVVRMNPTPLPLATIRIQVFNDQIPVDATYEADAERGCRASPPT